MLLYPAHPDYYFPLDKQNHCRIWHILPAFSIVSFVDDLNKVTPVPPGIEIFDVTAARLLRPYEQTRYRIITFHEHELRREGVTIARWHFNWRITLGDTEGQRIIENPGVHQQQTINNGEASGGAFME